MQFCGILLHIASLIYGVKPQRKHFVLCDLVHFYMELILTMVIG